MSIEIVVYVATVAVRDLALGSRLVDIAVPDDTTWSYGDRSTIDKELYRKGIREWSSPGNYDDGELKKPLTMLTSQKHHSSSTAYVKQSSSQISASLPLSKRSC